MSAATDNVAFWSNDTRKYLRQTDGTTNPTNVRMHPERLRDLPDTEMIAMMRRQLAAAFDRPEHSVIKPIVGGSHGNHLTRRPLLTPDKPPEGWSLKEAAAILRISRPALLHRIRRHGFRAAMSMGAKLSSAYANPVKYGVQQ